MPAFVVYLRLFRLARGFNRDRCRVSLRSLQRGCGLAQNTVAKALRSLLDDGFIEVSDPGSVSQSTEYKILLPALGDEAAALAHETELPHEMMQSSASPAEVITQHNIINTTTTTVGGREYKIDISPLNAIGLTEQHLFRFSQHSDDAIQNAIDAFAFDLQFNKKAKSIKGSPLNFFVGIMMRGIYSPPEKFEARRQKALRLECEARERVERERADREIAIQTEKTNRRRLVLKKIVDHEFEKWVKTLSDKEYKELLPPIARDSSHIARTYMRSYFEDRVLKISLDTFTENQLLSLFQNVNQVMRPRAK